MFFALKIVHMFWRSPKRVIITTDSKSVTQFSQTKVIPPPFWNECDFFPIFQLYYSTPSRQNEDCCSLFITFGVKSNEKKVPKIKKDVLTQPIKVHIESAGTARGNPTFFQ